MRHERSSALLLRRGLAKPEPRVIAVDDGPFARQDRTAPVVAAVVRLPGRLELAARTWVTVDGTDSTARIAGLLERLRGLSGVHAVLVDGVTVGGFNLVDLTALSRATGRAVIAVTRRPPDFPAIRRALLRYFPEDFPRRWALARAHRLFRVPTPGESLRAAAVGCRSADAIALLERSRLDGYWPEPLRLAHLLARLVGRPHGPGRTLIARRPVGDAGPVA